MNNRIPLYPILALVFLAIHPFSFAVEDTAPNILFTLTDDKGWPTLGAYGGDRVPAPNLGQPVTSQEVSTSQLRFEQAEIAAEMETLPRWVPSEQLHGRLGFHGVPRQAQWITLDLGETVRPDEIVLFPARSPADLGEDRSGGFPPEIEVEISEKESFEDAVRLGRWQEKQPGAGSRLPMLRFPVATGNQAAGRYLRLQVFGNRQRSGGRGRFFTLGEIVVLAVGRNAALRAPVSTSGGIENPPRWQAGNLTDGFLWCLPGRGALSSPSNGFHSGIESSANSPKWVEVDLGGTFPVDEIHLIPAHPQDFADTVGFGFPPRFRVTGFDGDGGERLLFDSGANRFPNPGAATVMLPVGEELIRRVRLECAELWHRTGDYLFALGEWQVWSGGENVALGRAVRASDEVETGIWDTDTLTDGFSSRGDLLWWRQWLDGLSRRNQLEARSAEIAAILAERSLRNRRRWLTVGIAAASTLSAVFGLILWRQKRQAKRSREDLRRRIAHDLHDELGASLSHLALQSDLARRQLPDGDPVRDRLVDISAAARSGLDNMRDVIWLLAPATDSWYGFRDRVESITERLLEGVEHSVEIAGEVPAGSPPIEWTREWVLFFKEVLTNARRHADAEKIAIALVWRPRSLSLEVRDDGRGFDPKSPACTEGLGLRSLRCRAAALNGILEIESAPEKGTTVRLDAPF